MMYDFVPPREEIAFEDRWNVEVLYSNLDAWEAEFSGQKEQWSKITALKGRLGESADVARQALDALFDLQRAVSKLYVYAHLRNDEDMANDVHKGMYQRASALYHEFATVMSWVEPELMELSEETLNSYIAQIQEYSFFLEKLVRMKRHTLTSREEELVALAGRALDTPSLAYGQMTNADFDFGTVVDSDGKEHVLSQGSFGLLMRSSDRVLRQNAFEAIHRQYFGHENGLTELLGGNVQKHIFHARSHHFPTALDAALYPKNIDTSVYRSLIAAVRNHLPALHRYMALRKQVLGVEELHLYDVYAPLVPSVDREIPFDEAVEHVIASVAPLGDKYQAILAQGLTSDRWVDRYENKGKRSGAYSSGHFDSMPYILMNYKGRLRDVYTLAHEAGHSMHSYLSHDFQPYHYSDYPIFVAEVASTFNEDLLFRHLLARAESPEERAYLISEKLDDIRATLFRQTMFAEFELEIHEMAERGEPITPAGLKEKYRQLNADYFGPDVVIDEEIAIEWARIPHFYYNFYVYQYATGISAALALSEKVNNGSELDRDAYLGFLQGGSSKYPLDLLEGAGVNMREPEAVESALMKFGELVDQLTLQMGSPAQ